MIPLDVGLLPCALQAIVFIGVAVWDINSSALDSDDKFASSRPLQTDLARLSNREDT
jgi:hypothetical protein